MAYDHDYDHDCHGPQHSVHFQIPSFVCSAAPTLAPGGGAEVLPLSLLSDNSTWFSNNGFTPRPFTNQYSQSQDDQESSSQAVSSYRPRQQQSLSAPFEFDPFIPSPAQTLSEPQPLRPLTHEELSAFIHPNSNPAAFLRPPLPSSSDLPALGLPVYSASGFDLLSILARVASRPHPRVILGPVDLTCSFVVVDVRRFDHPIVYCSPTFCRLTGYPEHEVLGRNCRFLQAPNGQVQRGDIRHFTDQTAVAHLKKNLNADKECQTSIVNYKKDGTAFINLVTVIPILGGVSGALHEENDVVYHVGFQVDLTEQPNAILEKLRDGSYIVDYGSQRNHVSQSSCLVSHSVGQLKDRKSSVIPSVRVSRELKKLLADPAFVKSIPITTSTTAITSSQPSSSMRAETDIQGSNQLLHLLLLEASPDFIHVVSLKGSFLYVAPSVRRVLGYEPEEMVGRSLSDYAHPEDVVPLMRELKEGSATGLTTAGGIDDGVLTVAAADQIQVSGMQMIPRTVDLLFRARTKAGVYVWIECKGRLHVEPGKGRKAIILSGRAKEMLKLDWHHVAQGGGLSLPVPGASAGGGGGGGGGGGLRQVSQTEVWGTMSSGQDAGGVLSFLVVGSAMSKVLGWTPSELVGREVVSLIVDGADGFLDEVQMLIREGAPNPRRLVCKMRHKNGSTVDMAFIVYRPTHDSSTRRESIRGIISAPLIYQLRSLSSFKSSMSSPSSTSFIHSLDTDLFEELGTSRDSSWQYEIQQIRFANQRLEDEIYALSKQLADAEDMQQKVLQEFQQQNAPLDQYTTDHHPAPFNYPPPGSRRRHRHQLPYLQHDDHTPQLPSSSSQHFSIAGSPFSQPTLPFSREWDSSAFVQNLGQPQPYLKRSWDTR